MPTILRSFEQERKYVSQKPSPPNTNNQKFNIKLDYDNAIPASNRSTHANLMIDNQHEKPTVEDVYRIKPGHIAKKP